MTPAARRRRLAAWLLGGSAPPGRADEVLDDLMEGHRRAAASRGRLRADLWLARQVGAWRLRRAGEGLVAFARWAREEAAAEVRRAGRRLARAPALGTAIVLTLGLVLGGTLVAFAAVDGVLLRPLPFPDASALHAIRIEREGSTWWSVSPLEVRAWSADARGVEGVAWFDAGAATSAVDGEPLYLRTARVSPGFFGVLGARLALGREFEEGDDAPGAPRRALLGYALWQGRFGGRLDVVGERIVLDDEPWEIVGVGPPEPLDFMAPHDLFVPRPLRFDGTTERGRLLQAIVRLAGGGDASATAAELQRVSEAHELESVAAGWRPRLTPLRDEVVGPVRGPLLLVFSATAALVLIALLNVASLLVARAESLRGDVAVRLALGAGRIHLVTSAFLEAALLAAAGTGVALFLAGILPDPSGWGGGGLLPREAGRLLSARGALFAAALAALATVGLGLASGLAAVRGRVEAPARRRGIGPSRSGGRTGNLLLAGQIASVVVLLAGAGVVTRSLATLQAVDPGFEPGGALVVDVALSSTRHPDVEAQVRALDETREALAAVPGVAGVASVSNVPFRGPGFTAWHIVESEGEPAAGEEPIGGLEFASPDYFATLGLPVVAGRVWTETEAREGRRVAVVDEVMARQRWPGRSPVGDRVRFGGSGSPWLEVVGVVGGARHAFGAPPRPRIYTVERAIFGPRAIRTLVVRSRVPVEALLPDLRDALERALPGAPVVRTVPLDRLAAASLGAERVQAAILSLLALVGVGLGAVGVYGLVSWQVGRRRREVGMRIALGADRASVVRTVAGGTLLWVGAGLGSGAAAAFALGRVWHGLAPALDAGEPTVVLGVAASVLVVAGVAALVPALRATRLDPRVAFDA